MPNEVSDQNNRKSQEGSLFAKIKQYTQSNDELAEQAVSQRSSHRVSQRTEDEMKIQLKIMEKANPQPYKKHMFHIRHFPLKEKLERRNKVISNRKLASIKKGQSPLRVPPQARSLPALPILKNLPQISEKA